MRRLSTLLPLIVLLSAPSTAEAACQYPSWDPTTSTYTLGVAAADTVDEVIVTHVGGAEPYGRVVARGCSIGLTSGEDMRHAVINAERDILVSVSSLRALVANAGAESITINRDGAVSLGFELDRYAPTVPYRIAVRADGFDTDGDGATDIVLNVAGLSSLKIVGANAPDRIDLRELTKQSWGRDTIVEYVGGSGASAARRVIRSHDTRLTVRAKTAFWGTTLISTGSKDVVAELGRGLDIVRTGSGDDTISSSLGNDRVWLGAGDDGFYSAGGDGTTTEAQRRMRRLLLFGGPGNDTLGVTAGRSRAIGGPGHDKIYVYGARNTVFGGPGNDYIKTNVGGNTINAGPGNDQLYLYMRPAQERWQRTNCGPGRDLINWPRRGMISCERTLAKRR